VELEPGAYAKQVEDYLARRNRGHLIRIVGPAFDLVLGWEARGIPLNVVHRGIDRYCERVEAKPGRRRPAQIQYCEADILDVFDEWRRATGVGMWDKAPASPSEASAGEPASRASLPAHLERVIARLTSMRSGDDRVLDEPIDKVVRELDAARTGAKQLRGEAREALLARLRQLDADLLGAVRAVTAPEVLRALQQDADLELAPFRERMPREAYEQAQRAAVARLLRERARLPVIAFD
jgi:hypothetical protein